MGHYFIVSQMSDLLEQNNKVIILPMKPFERRISKYWIILDNSTKTDKISKFH